MHGQYDKLFNWFEENKFERESNYPRSTELVFKFCDWLEETSDEDLWQHLDCELEQVPACRKEMINGCNLWLGE